MAAQANQYHFFSVKCMYIFLRVQNNPIPANSNCPHNDLSRGPSFHGRRSVLPGKWLKVSGSWAGLFKAGFFSVTTKTVQPLCTGKLLID